MAAPRSLPRSQLSASLSLSLDEDEEEDDELEDEEPDEDDDEDDDEPLLRRRFLLFLCFFCARASEGRRARRLVRGWPVAPKRRLGRGSSPRPPATTYAQRQRQRAAG